eukprot:TRINITY_DN2582_c1_g3_i1.p1 TRINITY_DN2582_c1_g3~~TRINITY_DN2582_c1_g3_i1.p1  ORF type:complete len:769 (+),score=108.57 TRINITY_DN2582_c1_g3_i1:510-2816(+)
MPMAVDKLLTLVLLLLAAVGFLTVVGIATFPEDDGSTENDFKKERVSQSVREVSRAIAADLSTCKSATWELNAMVEKVSGNKTEYAESTATSLLKVSGSLSGLGSTSIVIWGPNSQVTSQTSVVTSETYVQNDQYLGYVIPPSLNGISSGYIDLNRWSTTCRHAADHIYVIMLSSDVPQSPIIASSNSDGVSTSETDTLSGVLTEEDILFINDREGRDGKVVELDGKEGATVYSTTESGNTVFLVLGTTSLKSNNDPPSWVLILLFAVVYTTILTIVGLCLWKNLKTPTDDIVEAILHLGALNFEEVDAVISKIGIGSSQTCNMIRAITVSADSLKNFKAYLPKSLFPLEELFSDNEDDDLLASANPSNYNLSQIRAVSVSSRFSEVSIPQNPTETFLHPNSWSACLLIRLDEVERQMVSDVATISEWQNQYSDIVTIMETAGRTHGGGTLVNPFAASPGTLMLTWDYMSGRSSRGKTIRSASQAAMYLRSTLNITGIAVAADNCKTGHIGSSTTKAYVVIGSIIPRLYAIHAYAQFISKMIAKSVVLTDNTTATEINRFRQSDLHAPLIGMLKDSQAVVTGSISLGNNGKKRALSTLICEIRSQEDTPIEDTASPLVEKPVSQDPSWMYKIDEDASPTTRLHSTSMMSFNSESDPNMTMRFQTIQRRRFPFENIIKGIVNGDKIIKDDALREAFTNYNKSNPVDKVIYEALDSTKATPDDFIVAYVSTSIVSQWNKIPEYMLRATVPSSLISPEWHKMRSTTNPEVG